MVEVVITHKKGIQLVTPKTLTRSNAALARAEAEQNKWDGIMVYNGRRLNLRVSR